MDWKKIWAWCCDEDWIVVAIPGLVLGILLLIAGLTYWLWLLGGIGALVIAMEWLAIKNTGLSISDQFRTWKKKNRGMSWAILAAAAATFAALLFHLMVEIK